MKRVFIFFALAVLAAFAVGCDKSPAKPEGSLEDHPIKIGVLGPFSGSSDYWGKPYKDSILLAYEELGLTKDKVQLVFEDWGSSYPQCAMAIQKLINVDKVEAVINTFDKCGYIAAPILKRKGIPQVVLALDDRVADGKTTFTVWTPIRHTTELMLRELARSGPKRLALFVLRDYYPYRSEKEILAQIKNYPSLSIVHTTYFNPDERDFRTITLKARQTPWDTAIILAYPPTVTIVTRQLKIDGIKNVTSIEGFDQMEMADVRELIPEGTFWSGAPDHRPEFDAAFKKRFGYTPFTGPCYGYDSLKLLVKAFELNREHPGTALPGLSVMGAGGTTTITPEGWTEMPAYLKRWEGGKKVIVGEWGK